MHVCPNMTQVDTSSLQDMNPRLPEFKALHDLAERCLVAASTNQCWRLFQVVSLIRPEPSRGQTLLRHHANPTSAWIQRGEDGVPQGDGGMNCRAKKESPSSFLRPKKLILHNSDIGNRTADFVGYDS